MKKAALLPGGALRFHADDFSCSRPGCNALAGAAHCNRVRRGRHMVDARALKGGHTRPSCSNCVGSLPSADVASKERGEGAKKLPEGRRNVGPCLLEPRPKEGCAGIDCHLSKLAGFISIFCHVLDIIFNELEAKCSHPLCGAIQLELMHPLIAASKPMQCCEALCLTVKEGG